MRPSSTSRHSRYPPHQNALLPQFFGPTPYDKNYKPWTFRRVEHKLKRQKGILLTVSLISLLFICLIVWSSGLTDFANTAPSEAVSEPASGSLQRRFAHPGAVEPHTLAQRGAGLKQAQPDLDDLEEANMEPAEGDAAVSGVAKEEVSANAGAADHQKQDAVRAEFMHAWKAYKEFAWGFDDLHPVSRKGSNGYRMGLTLVDTIDTLIVMGFDDEYERCKQWVASSLVFEKQGDVNVFETTIRVMGGLLSAYALKKEQLFLDKAVQLADLMLVAFDTDSGVPLGTVSFSPNKAYNPSWSGGASTTSEVGSIQLEWRYLSHLTGNPIYARKVDKASAALAKMRKPRGLFTRYMNPVTGSQFDSTITLGARVDSIYEYFLKQWLQSGRTDDFQKQLYDDHIGRINKELLRYSTPSKLAYYQEITGSTTRAKMDHLVCFMPGLLALGAATDPVGHEADMEIAKQVIETCVKSYTSTATGLAPEIFLLSSPNDPVSEELAVDPGARHNLLRPETMESLFVMWRLTHDQKYRDYGWTIFQAFKKHCRLDGAGYSGLNDVSDTNSGRNWNDHMESFFLAETLKYAFLLFGEDTLLPLDEWVFNTEAHPFPVLQNRAKPREPVAAAA